MTHRALVTSPQTYARIGGILYLFIIAAALFAEAFVRGRLIVPGADATAANILGSEMLFRAGLAAEMLTCACDVALALILYVLLKPVSRNLALLSAFFRLTFVAIYATAKLFEIAALVVLGRQGDPNAFSPGQLHALAHHALRVHACGYGISLLFFGFCTALVGYLIHKSEYLPRSIGTLLVIGGAAYAAFSLIQMLSPAFAGSVLFPWLMLPGFVAELALALWLIFKGVDLPRWQEQAPA